jgi:S1-C subfamily serine protease
MRRNIIKKISGWALPLAACALIAIAAVKASETNRNPEFNIDRTPIERNESVSLSYSSVVKKVRPSIVSISTSKTVQAQNIFGDGISPFGDELFRRFFRR